MNSSNPETDNQINAGLRKNIYCTAIKVGDETEWDFLWDQMMKTNNANERVNIQKSLGCSKHIWLLKVFLFVYDILRHTSSIM